MHIVLLEPEIPQNAGNIARTCAVTNSVLHLIKPLGFSVEDKYLKRAGLDYWKLLDIRYYENFEDFCERNPNAKIWMASTKARHIYADVTYREMTCSISSASFLNAERSANSTSSSLKSNSNSIMEVKFNNLLRRSVSSLLNPPRIWLIANR